MADTNLGHNELEPSVGNDITESAGSAGYLHLEERQEDTSSATTVQDTVRRPAVVPVSPRALERTGTAEHLAARRPVTALNVDEPDIKSRLSELRAEMTRLGTGLRWGGQSVDDNYDAGQLQNAGCRRLE